MLNPHASARAASINRGALLLVLIVVLVAVPTAWIVGTFGSDAAFAAGWAGAIGVLAIAARRRHGWRVVTACLLSAFVLLGAASVGLLFAPAAVAAWLWVALGHPRHRLAPAMAIGLATLIAFGLVRMEEGIWTSAFFGWFQAAVLAPALYGVLVLTRKVVGAWRRRGANADPSETDDRD